jgi:hypothetical protein
VTHGASQHGSVKGHGFSRAVSVPKDSGFSPCRISLGLSSSGRVMLIILAVALLADAGCNRQPLKPAALFPASNEAAGWARIGDIRTFEAADLWKYIDGEAERYLKAGVQRVFTADYRYQNKIDAVVDIYTMGKVEGAKKIFESEPTGDARSVDLGDGARLHDQSLIFRKGPFLVRIIAYQESAETPQELLELGRVIQRRMTR